MSPERATSGITGRPKAKASAWRVETGEAGRRRRPRRRGSVSRSGTARDVAQEAGRQTRSAAIGSAGKSAGWAMRKPVASAMALASARSDTMPSRVSTEFERLAGLGLHQRGAGERLGRRQPAFEDQLVEAGDGFGAGQGGHP